MLEKIDKGDYDPTTTALAQIMAIRDVWSDLDIDWLTLINQLKKASFQGEKMIKASDKSIALVEDIFQQGDKRYGDNPRAVTVASFLDNKAIEIEKISITPIQNPSKEELKDIKPPQEYYKFVGKKLLEEKGYKLMGFEVPFCGGIADILAKNPSKKETIAVECCPCRIDKAIKFLENKDTILWILSLGKTGLPDEEIPLFVVKRGPNWDKSFKTYKQFLKEQIKKIKNPLDNI